MAAANTQEGLKIVPGTSRMYAPDARPFALLNGRSVRIVGEADVEGKSPCKWYVGADLKMNLEANNKFTIIDPSFLPASETALASLAQALTDATAGSHR